MYIFGEWKVGVNIGFTPNTLLPWFNHDAFHCRADPTRELKKYTKPIQDPHPK